MNFLLEAQLSVKGQRPNIGATDSEANRLCAVGEVLLTGQCRHQFAQTLTSLRGIDGHRVDDART